MRSPVRRKCAASKQIPFQTRNQTESLEVRLVDSRPAAFVSRIFYGFFKMSVRARIVFICKVRTRSCKNVRKLKDTRLSEFIPKTFVYRKKPQWHSDVFFLNSWPCFVAHQKTGGFVKAAVWHDSSPWNRSSLPESENVALRMIYSLVRYYRKRLWGLSAVIVSKRWVT